MLYGNNKIKCHSKTSKNYPTKHIINLANIKASIQINNNDTWQVHTWIFCSKDKIWDLKGLSCIPYKLVKYTSSKSWTTPCVTFKPREDVVTSGTTFRDLLTRKLATPGSKNIQEWIPFSWSSSHRCNTRAKNEIGFMTPEREVCCKFLKTFYS